MTKAGMIIYKNRCFEEKGIRINQNNDRPNTECSSEIGH